MRITRRQFLTYCSVAAGALGLSAATMAKLDQAQADIQGTAPDVIYIAAQGCSGCVTSLLNTAFYTDIGTLLLDTIDLNFQETVNAAPGVFLSDGGPYTTVNNSATEVTDSLDSGYVLVVEGSIPTGTPAGLGTAGDFCHIGNLDSAAASEKATDQIASFAAGADLVLAYGTCSSYGGIPAARGSATGATDTRTFLQSLSITTPVVRIPGCPPHPDWIVGTVVSYITGGVGAVQVNGDGAPYDYYGEYQCNAGPCVWRYNNHPTDAGRNSGDHDVNWEIGESRDLGRNKWGTSKTGATGRINNALGCLGILGCKGRKTKADCSLRKWNTNSAISYGDDMSWCVGSRGGCHGCTYPTFPDGVGKFFTIR